MRVYIFATIMLLFTFYRVFILQRQPYTITEKLPYEIIIIVVTLLCVQLYCIRNNVMLFRNQIPKNNWWKKFLSQTLEKYYYGPLKLISKKLLRYDIIKYTVIFWGNLMNITLPKIMFVYLATIYYFKIPLVLLGSCLLIDIFVFQKIHLFYIKIWFGIIPMILKGLFYITREYYVLLLEKIEQQKHEHLILHNNKRTHVINIIDCFNAISFCENTRIYILFTIVTHVVFAIGWSSYLLFYFYKCATLFNLYGDYSSIIIYYLRIWIIGL